MKLKYGLTYPTWQGVYLFGIFIALCIAAMMRQINLLLFIAGLLLGPLILSWFMAKIKKSWFKVQRRMPVTIHAESEFVLSLDLTNVSRGTLFALAARQAIVNSEFGIRNSELRKAPIKDNSAFRIPNSAFFFSQLPPNQKTTREFVLQIDRPGEYRLEPVELISRFPLGLFECRVRVGRAATFWVYPALLDDLPEDLIQLTAQSWDGVSRETNHSSRNVGDFHSVSAYRPGEDVRLIHWRSSARLGDLVIRQFQPPLGAWLGIVVDMTPPEELRVASCELRGGKAPLPIRADRVGCEENESNALPEEIQHNIKLAATVIYRLCSKTAEYSGRETQIVLALSNSPDNIVSGRADSNFFHQAMQTLASAQLDNSGQNKTAETISAVKELVPEGTKIVTLETLNNN